MYIDRTIEQLIIKNMIPGKVVVLYGARRVGKTMLLRKIMEKMPESYLYLNGEDLATHDLLDRRTIQNYQNALGGKRLLVIDEAQKIPYIGEKLKLMIDEIDGLKILITGSSAFDINEKTGEPLTGRKISFPLYPLSEEELSGRETISEREGKLRMRLIYGNYPELLSLDSEGEKADYLKELIGSLLLKDILSIENVRNSSRLINLLRLIAFQIGGEVSIQELAKQLQISRPTVEKYLDLLTKVFILFKVEGFSRNLRKEIVKSSKWYFHDNGIRNAICANFNPITLRADTGQLWENYITSERLKFQQCKRMSVNNYFWRTYDGQEIDKIEDRGGKLYAYEMKFNNEKAKIPGGWAKAYPDAQYRVITQKNYFPFLTGDGEVE